MEPTMRQINLKPVTFIALAAFALGGCSMFDNLGGAKKFSPDEFKIVSHSPLTMPPTAELRPPRPGEPRPQETLPSDQAREALSPSLAGRAARSGTPGAVPAGTPEAALVARATKGGVDPNIRSTVNTDSRVIADADNTFIDSLIFWHDKPVPGVVLDPAKEQQRLREAQVSGQQSTGATPTIERRKRGLLEGLF
jgi:hypothetical protein